MNQFFCMFFPPVVAVAVLRMLQRRRLDRQYALMAYAGFACGINLLIFLFQTFVLGAENDLLQELSFNNLYMVQYLGAALLFAVVLPLVFEVARRHIHLRLEVLPEEPEDTDGGEDGQP